MYLSTLCEPLKLVLTGTESLRQTSLNPNLRWLVMHTWLHDTLWGAVNVLLFNVIVFMLFMSHARAVFSDPGIVPLPQHRIDFSDLHSAGSGK